MKEVTKTEWLPQFYFFQCLDIQARMSLRHNQLGVQITSASAEQKIAVGTGSPTTSKSFGGGTTKVKVPAICPKTCEEFEEQLSMRVQIFNNVDEINANTNFTY